MAKPHGAQVLLKAKAVALTPQESGGKGRRVSMLVSAHQLWIAEGQEVPVADIQSVVLSGPTTVTMSRIGRSRPYEFQTKGEKEARELRACLLFQAKYTRGGIPGVEDWRQLTSPAYDRLDVSGTAIPAAATPVTAVQGGKPKVPGLLVGLLVGVLVVVIAGVGFAVYRATHQPTVPKLSEEEVAEILRRADAALERGDLEQAVSQFRQVLPSRSKSAEVNAKLAGALMDQGNFDEAIDPLKTAVQYAEGDHPEYSAHLAYCYNKTNQPEKALVVLRKARDQFPDDVDVNYELVWTLTRKGLVAEALTISRKLYTEHPDLTSNAATYASLLAQTGRRDEAVSIYLRLGRGRKDVDAFLNAAALVGKSGDLKRAEEIVDEARRAQPGAERLQPSNTVVLASLGVEFPKPAPIPTPPPRYPQPSTDLIPTSDQTAMTDEVPLPSTDVVPFPSTDVVPLPEPETVVAPIPDPYAIPEQPVQPIPDPYAVPEIPATSHDALPEQAPPPPPPADEAASDNSEGY